MRSIRAFFVVVLFASIAAAQSYSPQDSFNNTAACSASGSPSYCFQGFSGMSDVNRLNADNTPFVFNAVPQNTSDVSVNKLLPQGTATFPFVHFQPWFCNFGVNQCPHVSTGYNSAESGTIAGQVNDMLNRGFKGLIIDWYGLNPGSSPTYIEQTTQDIKLFLNTSAQCSSAQNCKFYYALMYDPGALRGGRCSTSADCISKVQNDITDAFNTYFSTNAYLRVANQGSGRWAIQQSGRPVLLVFDQSTIKNLFGVNFDDIKSWADATWGASAPLIIYQNAVLGNPNPPNNPDGEYAWIGHYGPTVLNPGGQPYGLCTYKPDPVIYGEDAFSYCYLQNFYDTSVGHTGGTNWLANGKLIIGAAYKDFEKIDSTFDTDFNKKHYNFSSQCGKTWLQSFQQSTAHSDYSPSRPLPMLGVATWNDYDEGSEIETGISNCLQTFNAPAINSNTITWSFNFTFEPAMPDDRNGTAVESDFPSPVVSGDTSTIDHYALWDMTASIITRSAITTEV